MRKSHIPKISIIKKYNLKNAKKYKISRLWMQNSNYVYSPPWLGSI